MIIDVFADDDHLSKFKMLPEFIIVAMYPKPETSIGEIGMMHLGHKRFIRVFQRINSKDITKAFEESYNALQEMLLVEWDKAPIDKRFTE